MDDRQEHFEKNRKKKYRAVYKKGGRQRLLHSRRME